MHNKTKIAAKIFLLVMMPTFYQNGVVVKINAMRGEKLQKVQYDPPFNSAHKSAVHYE